ncbi:MAG: sugar ABC transporter substrate-binding protein [Chloroflexi bacterium]|nr:sugar ABC transporter substrate-binding protein [Chloroflexota bacterium]
MVRKTTLPFVIGLLLLVGLAACGNDGKQKPTAAPTENPAYVIGYSAPELIAGQRGIMEALVRHAEGMGWSVQAANANSDPATQAEQIEYFISSGVDVVVAVPVDSQRICETVEKVQQAHIPFYTIDRAPIGCSINMTVLSDNFMAGQQSGEELVRLLTARYGRPSGKVLELQGDLRQNVALERGGGFHVVVDEYPAIEVISRPTEWQPDQIDMATREVLNDTPVDAIYLHSDCAGVPVVLPILSQMGKELPRTSDDHIFIVGVDGCAETLQAIRDGFVDQASGQPISDFGIIVRWIDLERQGQPIEAGPVIEAGALWSPAMLEQSDTGWQLFLATASITPANVDDPGLWGNQ